MRSRAAFHSRTSLWSSRSPFPRKSDFGGQRQSGHNVRGGRAREIQRPSRPDGRRRYGLFGAAPGNLCSAASDWWAREDSNLQPSGYERRYCTGKINDSRHFCARSWTFARVWLRRFIGYSLVEQDQAASSSLIPYRDMSPLPLPTISGREERSLDMEGVRGSIPLPPTSRIKMLA
jgi:hypothetical protein